MLKLRKNKNMNKRHKKSRFKSIGKKVTVVGLTALMAFGVVHITPVAADGEDDALNVGNTDNSAEKITQTYIDLAQNKKENSDIDLNDFTDDMYQFMGIYLSNFYSPFNTELGDGQSEKAQETMTSEMVSAINKTLKFDNDTATDLVNTTLNIARGNMVAKENIHFYASYGIGDTQDAQEITGLKPNLYNYFSLMVGNYLFKSVYCPETVVRNPFTGKTTTTLDNRLPSFASGKEDDIYKNLIEKNVTNDNTDPYNNRAYKAYDKETAKKLAKIYHKIWTGTYPYGFLGYKDGDKIKIISDFYFPNYDQGKNASLLSTDDDFYNYPKMNSALTPSQYAFINCLKFVNLSNGNGLTIFNEDETDYKGDDPESSAKKAVLKYMKSNVDDSINTTMLGGYVTEDCFGDIVFMGSSHQIIMVPGCINPYIWAPVTEDGQAYKDVRMGAGSRYNIANGISMNLELSKNLASKVENGLLLQSYLRQIINMKRPLGKNDDIVKLAQKEGFYKYNYFSSDKDIKPTYIYPELDSFYNNIPAMKGSDSPESVVKGSKYKYTIPIFRNSSEYDYRTTFGDTKDVFFNTKGEWYAPVEKAFNGKTITESTSAENILGLIIKNSKYNSRVTNLSWQWLQSYTVGDGGHDSIQLQSTANINVYSNNYYDVPVAINDNIIFVDNLGAYKGSDITGDNSDTFQADSFLGTGQVAADFKASKMPDSSAFTNKMQASKTGHISDYQGTAQEMSTIYLTYLIAYYGSGKLQGKLGYKIDSNSIPTLDPNKQIAANTSKKSKGSGEDKELNDIKHWVYYLLHPTTGFRYVSTWVRNKVNHILLQWHYDMNGSNGVGAYLTGTTKYRSTVGFVTMPELSELNWTQSLLSFYNQALPVILIAMLIIFILSAIVGMMTWQGVIIASVIFATVLIGVFPLMNFGVKLSNDVSETQYGNKFIYWAMLQQESYQSAIDKAATGDSYKNYLQTLYVTNEEVYNNQSTDTILLKWQAPKKMASLMMSGNDAKELENVSDTGKALLYKFLGNTYSGESYADDSGGDKVYMYRSYLDLTNFSRYIYDGFSNARPPAIDLKQSVLTSNSNETQAKDIYTMYNEYQKTGFEKTGSYGDINSSDNKKYYLTAFQSSSILRDLASYMEQNPYSNKNWHTHTSAGAQVPLNQDLFNYSIPYFTGKLDKNIDNWMATGGSTTTDGNSETVSESRKDALQPQLDNASDADMVGLAAYALYSENPYYYFSWKLFNDGLKPTSKEHDDYKNLLLSDNYFYSADNGGLKDFMDMRGLFTCVVPYLHRLNQYVTDFDKYYGISIYDGVPTEEGHWQDEDIQSDPELQEKYWHNLNVARLYGIWSPWVGIMYECEYAKPTQIKVMGKTVTVNDPLNPASYPAERPMVFSEAEMLEYGMTEADLTPAERKILQLNKDMQKRMYQLLNYYTFSDVTLDSAAAIEDDFAFNTIFSQTGIHGNHNIYPKSFELNGFSYDAYLRMILSNSSGESLLDTSTKKVGATSTGESTGDFYERLVNNSSVTTAIMIDISDIISVYVVPAFKIVFMILLLASAICCILANFFKASRLKTVLQEFLNKIIVPMIKFYGVTILFAWVLSLMLGDGNTAVTGTTAGVTSISFGDPVVAMFVLMILEIGMLITYFKVIKDVWKDLKQNLATIKTQIQGVTGAIVAGIGGAIAGGAIAGGIKNMMSGGTSSGGSGGSGGTGGGSARAERRANKNSDNVVDASERKSASTSNDTVVVDANNSSRRAENKKVPISQDKQSEKSKMTNAEKTEKYNEKIKEGAKKTEQAEKAKEVADKM